MSAKPSTLRCPLCGFEFELTESVCTHGCPLGRFCKLMRCPNCQYEFPAPTSPLRWLVRWFHKAAAKPGALDLTQVEAGETVEFVGVVPGAERRGRALAVYGVTPGVRLTLQQKRPAFLVRVGETELALDEEIARQLVVRRADAPAH